jgi:hypothetical protein
MEKNAVFTGEKWLPYRDAGPEQIFSVHSVFNKVINITSNQGLLSVAAENAGGSSAFLVVQEVADFKAMAGDPCFVNTGRMRLGNYAINFQNAVVWKGPVCKNFQNKKIRNENIAAFKAVLDRKAHPKSAWRCLNTIADYKAISKLLEEPFLAYNLIGVGMGLTPAGDDMLIGYLAIANHVNKNYDYLNLLRKVISDSLHRTVDLSKQALMNALNCDYHEYVQNCIRDLCERGREEIYISAATLIGIGATSGSDIACGMYFAMIDLE